MVRSPISISISISTSLLALACTLEPEPEPELAAVGDGCEQSSECESGRCEHLVCVQDQDGPSLWLIFPEDLGAFDSGLASVYLLFSVDTIAAGDRVRITIDPGQVGETTAVFDEFPDGSNYGSTEVPVPAGLSDGPHRLRVQIIDASGEPYPNPSATDERVIFVRDAQIPSTPQVVIHWPRSGHEYRAGQPLDIEVAVLPGSFAFSSLGGDCHPLDDCTPVFAPECEDSCGPVARSGSVLVYVEEDFPACIADEPIGCATSYVASLRPDSNDAELLDGYLIRGPMLLEPGEYTLTAALSYSDGYSIYPSAAAVIYDQIPISVR